MSARPTAGRRPAADRIPVAVLGATGIVGQRLVQMLESHPWFRLAEVVGSRRSAGQRYGEAVAWGAGEGPAADAAELAVLAGDASLRSPVVLSALPSSAAEDIELALARAGHVVCTNASAHRLRGSVPLVVPEVNPEAVETVRLQPWAGTGGALIANPNCVVNGLALALAPLHRAFGIEAVTVVTLQAVSGAGRTGVGAVAMVGNVIPWIRGEEEKFGPELGKILDCELTVAAAVNRVPVLDGHLAHVFCSLRHPASPGDAARVLRDFRPPPKASALPSTPGRPLVVRDEPDRPQPRLDKDSADGMAVSVGRIRAAGAPAVGAPHDLAFAVVSHNGVRGAAGACLSNAELCVSEATAPLHLRSDPRHRAVSLPGPDQARELPRYPTESHA